jgi:DNA-binding response OmpR family regulator
MRDAIYQRLIDLFRKNPNCVLTYQHIYEVVWGVPWIEDAKHTLRSNVSQVRYLMDAEIRSVRGVGYIYLPEEVFGKEDMK